MVRSRGVFVLLLLLALATGCKAANSGVATGLPNAGSGDNAGNMPGGSEKKEIRIVHYVSGVLGDKGFFDSAERGLMKANYVFGYGISTVVGGKNSEAWAPGLEKLASSGDNDIILVGTYPMKETVKKLAGKYPKQKFIFYDGAIDGPPNIYSMLYSQSEGSFLAGAFAAMVTTNTGLKHANPDKMIGFIGGMEDDTIMDFLSGYKQGAAYIDPEVKVVSAFVGNFTDKNRAKELAAKQYLMDKADIIYNASGGAGLGILEEGHDLNKYTIGVDSNQNPLYPGSVLTSMLKNIDESVFRALSLERNGTLPYGSTEMLGVKDFAIDIARDNYYEQYVPVEIRDRMKDIQSMIASGKIKVKSELDLSSPSQVSAPVRQASRAERVQGDKNDDNYTFSHGLSHF